MVSQVAKLAFCALILSCASGCKQDSEREFIVYTWSEYFSPEVLESFANEHHVHVKTDYFSSNEQLLAKLILSAQSKGRGPDLIMPSDYMVQTMVGLNLLKPLDHAELHFLTDFAAEFLHPPYDTNLKYTVPMAIGTSGLAVNTQLAPDLKWQNLSWRDALENPRFKNRVTLLDDPREVVNVALMILGRSWTSASEQDIHDAFAYLNSHRGNVRALTAETRPAIEANDCILCQTYSGDAMQISIAKPEIQYLIPREGAAIWADNFALPRGGREDRLAYAFMNKVLSHDGAKRFTETIFYRTANDRARSELPAKIASNSTIYISGEQLQKLRYLQIPLKLTLLIDKEWTKFKAQ